MPWSKRLSWVVLSMLNSEIKKARHQHLMYKENKWSFDAYSKCEMENLKEEIFCFFSHTFIKTKKCYFMEPFTRVNHLGKLVSTFQMEVLKIQNLL